MYTKKNQGNVPKCKDERLRYVPAKCGKCIECRREKARNWRIRLAEELKIILLSMLIMFVLIFRLCLLIKLSFLLVYSHSPAIS